MQARAHQHAAGDVLLQDARARTAPARCRRPSCASVGAGGGGRVHSSSIAWRSRNGAGRVTMIQPRTPRTGHVAGQRAADAPRPRAGRHDHVRGLDAAVVGEHARDVVAAAQQLAHGAAGADLGAGGARVVGQRGGGRAGIDAAGVEVELGALDASARAAARPRAARPGPAPRRPPSLSIRQPCGSRSNANAPPLRSCRSRKSSSVRRPIASIAGWCGPITSPWLRPEAACASPAASHSVTAQPAPRARGRDGDADDAAADHDDVGRAAHSRPASAA